MHGRGARGRRRASRRVDVPAAEVVVVWAVPPGRVYATAPATTRLAAPSATVAERSRVRPRCRATTADSASWLPASMVPAPSGCSPWSVAPRCLHDLGAGSDNSLKSPPASPPAGPPRRAAGRAWRRRRTAPHPRGRSSSPTESSRSRGPVPSSISTSRQRDASCHSGTAGPSRAGGAAPGAGRSRPGQRPDSPGRRRSPRVPGRPGRPAAGPGGWSPAARWAGAAARRSTWSPAQPAGPGPGGCCARAARAPRAGCPHRPAA